MITLTATPNAVVAMEGNGWPLGLGNINSRITAARASEPVAPPQPRLRQRQISSFSSLSSSDLDTESTASFFPDQSVQLGRLIGMRPIGGNKVQREKEGNVGGEGCHHRGGHSPRCGALDPQGFCTPLLHHVIARIFRRPKHTLISQ